MMLVSARRRAQGWMAKQDWAHTRGRIQHFGGRILAMTLLLGLPAVAMADEERGNSAVVVASSDGECYAKSVPEGLFGDAGQTTVYEVETGTDRPLATFNWYAREIYLACGVYLNGRNRYLVVRMGPWARGYRAAADDLALEIYSDGALLARYSTLDIAGTPDNVSHSVSHYRVFAQISGLGWSTTNDAYGFHATTIDDRELYFSPSDGAMQVLGSSAEGTRR